MGALLSKKGDDDKRNSEIDRQLAMENKKVKNTIKLLLLGTGESGKSTVAKQLKILHMSGFSKEELLHYKSVLYSNVMVGIATLIEQAPKLGYEIAPGLAPKLTIFADPNVGSMALTPAIAQDVKAIWADRAIQQTYERRAEFQLHGSVPYIVDNIDRLADKDADINQEDVLQCRIRTTGIVEIEFELEGYLFRVMDVGGQRSERRKWINCFDDVTAVIFCVALSEYDEKLCEDNRVNRMLEALDLFAETANNKAFKESAIVLFLNKSDLFRDKIKKVDLATCFPDYTGGADFDKAGKFITQKFIAKSQNSEKMIYPHVTCATDTENVRVVFNTVRASILTSALQDLAI